MLFLNSRHNTVTNFQRAYEAEYGSTFHGGREIWHLYRIERATQRKQERVVSEEPCLIAVITRQPTL